jgi:hypothetical protein
MSYTIFASIVIKISHRNVNISELEKIILCPKPEFLSGVLIGAPRRGECQINKSFSLKTSPSKKLLIRYIL